MARHTLTLTVSNQHGSRPLTLSLDLEHMSQKFMLNDFANGRLYESETSNFLGSILAPGDTFIDIGAHVGYFSMLASGLVGEQGRVYSFEPEPRNYSHLLEHIELNSAGNVTPVHMAVGAAPHVAEFFVNADNDGGHALWEVGRHPFNEQSRQRRDSRRVYVTSLDRFFGEQTLPSLKAIKIDAEGAEFAILVGARKLLMGHRVPFVIAEVNRFGLDSMGASENHLRNVMYELGYETYLFQPGQSWMPKLEPNQFAETNYVFNILFRHPEAPAIAA